MRVMLWLLVIGLAFEAMVFGNSQAFVIGFILAVIGILLEAKKDVV